ncbi:hypothetical protein VPNG_07612 [Cytospora leucostoma]|uniref:Uncharacterized protein n=1 Tax=Cytospora leucostoma TaxID=1230097 RepID=A0A423WD92_9PEZI|nr:hypothetical protein VPNG_07612 [Cytospora leucostoma]
MILPNDLFLTLFFLTFLLATSLAQNRTTVADWIPQVAGNSLYAPEKWRTTIGGQNFTWCCVQAIADSLEVSEDGKLVTVENAPIADLNVSNLLRAIQEGQFPCTARYDSAEPEGAPEIYVAYVWLADTCPGWALSSGSNLNGWLQPLSGFLLPAVIFCLSVPRRRKLHVFREFFQADLVMITGYISAFFGAIGAMLIVTIDTIVWLSVCWALSGPMILSGLYEAVLDNLIINFVQVKMKNGHLTVDMRCRLLICLMEGIKVKYGKLWRLVTILPFRLFQAIVDLKEKLANSYSFGSMVGAPVVFFLGGFIFALVQSIQSLGDEDTALALAFGQWYMTIPHIAIISGLLLAGNNPNILEGVCATKEQEAESDLKISFLNFGLAYPSCYKVAWQWHRGHNKLGWVEQLIHTYGHQDSAGDQSRGLLHEREAHMGDMDDLWEQTTLSPYDWLMILFMATFLLGVPFVLAFITAYYTPEVGLSCRSFTFTIYACAELGQVILWLWAYAGPPGKTRRQVDAKGGHGLLGFFRSGGWLHSHGFYEPRNVDHLLGRGEPKTLETILKGITTKRCLNIRSWWCGLWYTSYVFFGIVATFASLGGTVMQLLGVYSADICQLKVDEWLHPYRPGVTAMISQNSAVMIRDAETYWKPCAISAIAFMTFVSFVGWWYQRRMKDLFTNLVSQVDLDKHDRADMRRSRWLGSTPEDKLDSREERHRRGG